MRLGRVLRAYRHREEWDLRHMGHLLGISAATLLRIENGFAPEGRTLAKILNWLMQDAEPTKAQQERIAKRASPHKGPGEKG